MRKVYYFVLFAVVALGMAAPAAWAQRAGSETITGTVVSYGAGFNTRVRTNNFTLNLTGVTPPDQVQRALSMLQENGQDALQKEIANQDLGRFSIGGRLGRTINGVVVTEDDGRRRIFAIFERWIQFGELRGGYRSVDYPFGVIEIFIDPRTGKGEGTLIEAAQIRFKRDKKTGNSTVEIENFATYPSRLLNIKQSGKPL